MVGATEEELTRDKIPYESGIARYREISRGPIVGDDSGMFKMLFHREDGRLLGCHCIGSGATELIHVGQAYSVSAADSTIFSRPSSTIRRWPSVIKLPPIMPPTSWPWSGATPHAPPIPRSLRRLSPNRNLAMIVPFL